MSRERILTIDDDPDILDVLDLTLSEFYDVLSAGNGQEGLAVLAAKNPNLIICDYMMPVMNGKEFCRALKKDILLRHIPVIMLTGKGEVQDMVGGIEAGADDYIVKPFEPDALLARIRMILRRTVQSLDANPLTHLPGNTSIMEKFTECIQNKKPFAVGYADINKFKTYNDHYGFEKGDEVIRETARIIVQNVLAQDKENAFIGHVGGDDFVFLVHPDMIDHVSQRIVHDFDAASPSFYNETDRSAGYIIGKDRQGNTIKTGFLSISIAVVSSVTANLTHVAQIAEIGAELKRYAKSFDKSIVVRDKRKN